MARTAGSQDLGRRTRRTRLELRTEGMNRRNEDSQQSSSLKNFFNGGRCNNPLPTNDDPLATGNVTARMEILANEFYPEPPVEANIDDVADYDMTASPDEPHDVLEDGNPMKFLMDALVNRLREETSMQGQSAATNYWLTSYLKRCDFLIHGPECPHLCKKLMLSQICRVGYYKDIKVWIPELQYGELPPCPKCGENGNNIGNHGFDKHNIRLVIGLETNYYVLGHRYICHTCNYRFRPWNETSLSRQPRGKGLEFPAFLTKRLGIDKKVLSLARCLRKNGIRMDTVSKILLELHSIRYDELRILDAYVQQRQKLLGKHDLSFFSYFGDKSGYNGHVPTGQYLSSCLNGHHSTIRPFLEGEMKKIPLDILKIDVSYKIPKLMAFFEGVPIFKGLVTVKNGYNEIRKQFFVATDSHDQILSPMDSMKATMEAYGEEGPALAYTDDPTRDKAFLLATFPSLEREQQHMDRSCLKIDLTTPTILPSPPNVEQDQPSLSDSQARSPPMSDADIISNMKHLSRKNYGNTFRNLRELFRTQNDPTKRYIGFDLEWPLLHDSRGRTIGTKRITVITLGFRETWNSKMVCSILYEVAASETLLPKPLVDLLSDKTITFCGRSVNGDITRLKKDFVNCSSLTVQTRDVAEMFRRRGLVTQSGRSGLEHLAEYFFGRILDKSLQTSDFGGKLTDQQQLYACKDAVYSLCVYEELLKLPDLSIPLTIKEAAPGMIVDIAPYRGTLGHISAVGAIATILDKLPNMVHLPSHYKLELGSYQHDQLKVVLVSKIIAPSLKIPTIKKRDPSTRKVTVASLADFGVIPFEVIIPVAMLRQHIKGRQKLALENSFTNTEPVREPISQTRSKCYVKNLQPEHDQDHTLNGDIDDDATPEDIAKICQLFNQGSLDLKTPSQPTKNKALKPPPKEIIDKFSSVLGDGFHAMFRIKVPVRHSAKKMFLVCLREAFYVWDKDWNETVCKKLKEAGFSDFDIEMRRYYSVDFLTEMIPRHMPPPSTLYWRVRAVFECFGDVEDIKTKKPLFNKEAWSKAQNVLDEILRGFYSDPPGRNLHMYKLDALGNTKYNKYDLPLIMCIRGTGSVELTHKLLRPAVGISAPLGIRSADVSLAEIRHSMNVFSSRKNRPGYPNVGHCNTWLTDALQNLYEEIFGINLYPGWVNSSNYAKTDEFNGIVPIASPELLQAMNQHTATLDTITLKLSPDLQYLATKTNVVIPALPWARETKLFPELALHCNGDAEAICFAILKHVDGISVFPKLPVYNRIEQARVNRNINIRETTLKLQTKTSALKVGFNSNLAPNLSMASRVVDSNRPHPSSALNLHSTIVTAPEDILPIHPIAVSGFSPAAFEPPFECFVANISVSVLPDNYHMCTQKKRGYQGNGRSKDGNKRKPRTCKQCKKENCRGAKTRGDRTCDNL